ncbi:hypothetical protein [Rhodococcus erythropolis]|uniref:hypothetical protein n=1 Tax=Rhodococcus erythropolis TaxID=1833 RepID=UPI002226CA2A|nr:hypothetical protein [Rhodococcus erythropolis]MCW2295464.1 DNA invertase Pin-like site-specific DNA recombinase [Rhodococcus erythropolis]
MFGMQAVLAELQRELIVANTRDWLAAARARGRKGGRLPKLTDTAIAQARTMTSADAATSKIAEHSLSADQPCTGTSTRLTVTPVPNSSAKTYQIIPRVTR